MALSIIHGPPNSGRAGLVRERFIAARGRDPVLVVPNIDDVFSFQRDLCPPEGALLGGSVTTFTGLFGEAAAAAGAVPPAELTTAQRLRATRAAVASTGTRILAASARSPGFAPALDELIGELQAAEKAPADVLAGASELEHSAFLTELADVYATYLELRDRLGRGDRPLTAARAIEGLRGDRECWRSRPVFLYGFDDLTPQQLSLVVALADVTDVTATVTYEDRDALAARSRLLGLLRDQVRRDPDRDVVTPPVKANTDSAMLFGIERAFLEPGATRVVSDGSLEILRCGGERGEAEAIGGRIAALLAEGTEPGEIAVAIRDPAAHGALVGRVLANFGIPVAVEAEVPVAATATGAALLGLLRAALGDGEGADLLQFLRAPGRGLGASVDVLERQSRRGGLRGAEEAAAAWVEAGGRGVSPYERLRAARDDPRELLRIAAEEARDLAEWPLKLAGRQGEPADATESLELRAGDRIASELEELLELVGLEPEASELPATVAAISIPLWRGPAEDRVRVASPYRLRAARFSAVFVASLQDGDFPRHRSGGPFLTDQQRAAIEMPARIETGAEERYLFYSCLSLPRRSLTLSYRSCDEEGASLAPSPYLDDVRATLDPPPPPPSDEDPTLEALIRRHDLSTVTFAAAEAPSPAELARALAAEGREGHAARLAGLEVEGAVGDELLSRLAEAAAYNPRPGPLALPSVLAELAQLATFGGTTLEEYSVCPYRWFIGHELRPRLLDPDPEPLAQGGVLHAVLEELYRERPGGEDRPGEDSTERWIDRGRELLGEALAVRGGIGASPVAARIAHRRIEGFLDALLRRDATRTDSLRSVQVEAGFGADEDSDAPPLTIDDWSLHGRIDRIDSDPESGLAVVHDYKLSREVPSHSAFERRGRLQLALYVRAARESFGLDAAAGLYQPLGAGSAAVPRGLGRSSAAAAGLDGLGLPNGDWLDDEKFEARLSEAVARAREGVAGIREGKVVREPLGGKCPRYCTFAPICRIDRRSAAEENGGGEG